MKKYVSGFILICCLNSAFPQQDIDGKWDGAIDILGSQLGISVKLHTDADSVRGTIDIPQQGAKDLALIHVSHSGGKVYFELPAGQTLAVFDGGLAADSIKGKFTQAGLEGAFVLRKSTGEVEEKKTEILPYNQEEITFKNGENTFAGTLTTPMAKGKHPAVVMITGSGAQNRDEEIFGFKIFGIIADHLTRNGIAVLRYDDRGVGGSKGKGVDESTSEDFAYDVIEAVKYLKTRSDINGEQIGLIGHSEGGIVAPLAASRYDGISFIVLIAGTGVNGKDVLVEQSKLIMKAEGSTDDEVEAQTDLLNKTFAAMKTNMGWDDVKEGLRKELLAEFDKMPEEKKKYIKDKDEYIKTGTEIQWKVFQNVWFKYFMDYDPAKTLEKVKVPVLMLFGQKDLQVPPKQNAKPMEEALKRGGNKDLKLVILPDANHLFQKAATGAPSEYAKLPKEFAPGFLDTITAWILQRVTVMK